MLMPSVREEIVGELLRAYAVPRERHPQTMGQLSVLVGELCARENVARNPEIRQAIFNLLRHRRRDNAA